MGAFDRRSYLAIAGYDIRVTSRCLTEDLGRDDDPAFEGIAGLPIIRGLCGKHDRDPSFVDTVGPAAGARTLGTLQYGSDHRGAVWFDRQNNAFWLCAYGRHRSGTTGDAFPFFMRSLERDRMYPTDEDRIALYRDRAERIIDAIPGDADALRARAIVSLGEEFSGTIGGASVRMVVVDVTGLHEAHIAITMLPPDLNLIQALLYALSPTADVWGAWRPEIRFPTGALDVGQGEFAYSCVLD